MVNKKNYKDLDYYFNLPWTYTVETEKDENGRIYYIVSVNELPIIKTDAYSVEEAMELIKEPMEAVFEIYLEKGREIPEPINEEQFKGNIAYRTTSKRHYLLAKEAQKRNLSLSKLIDNFIDNNFIQNKP